MKTSTLSALHPSRRKPIAACMAVIFALVAPTAMAATINVANCSDGIPAPVGSLREAVPLAGEGGTVNLAGLPAMGCSMITLTAGEIPITQQSLSLIGPTTRVTIAAQSSLGLGTSRIFNHQGNGSLDLENLNIRDGSLYSATHGEYGGCILSTGNVYLGNSMVENCRANAKNAPVAGGGVFVRGYLNMVHSTITHNSAGTIFGSAAYGGGADVGGTVFLTGSTISNNTAGKAGVGLGGGIHTLGTMNVAASTISGNTAADSFGGIYLKSTNTAIGSGIVNSTISGNKAVTGIVGGMYSNRDVVLQNSTVAFNTAAIGKRSDNHYDAPGLDVVSVNGTAVDTDIQSSILSNNTYGGLPDDFSAYNMTGSSINATGANNLIGTTTLSGNLGVIAGRCPYLGSLSNNGGETQTHALLSHSSALDQGNDNATDPQTLMPYPFDQRGAPFQRVNHGQADIGAYEVQQADIVFNTSFEGCL